MAIHQHPDRDSKYMQELWGTSSLITDYWSIPVKKTEKKMLREISNDEITPKKHDFAIQNEIHEKIRNDEDYDDWSYGTEPFYGQNL
jgi:hypothetical protein